MISNAIVTILVTVAPKQQRHPSLGGVVKPFKIYLVRMRGLEPPLTCEN